LPFTVTAISQRVSPFEDARPNRTRTRAIAFCLVPRDDNSILGPLQRGIPGATAAFAGLASVSDRAFGGVLRGRLVEDQTFRTGWGRVDGRRWIISDEHIPGVFRERLRVAPRVEQGATAVHEPARV
jgi:hypothetical protein